MLNKAMIIGNLGADPETRHLANGGTVCNLSVATTAKWKDKSTGEWREKTEWHKVVLWNKLAEIATEYVKKGSRVFVEGRLETEKWQDRDGNDRYTTKIQAFTFLMMDRKGQNSGGPAPSTPGGVDDIDDEIPF